jgi:hypothetical protein
MVRREQKPRPGQRRPQASRWATSGVLLGIWAAAWTWVAFMNLMALPFGLLGLPVSIMGVRQAMKSPIRGGRLRAWGGVALSLYAAIFGLSVLIDGMTRDAEPRPGRASTPILLVPGIAHGLQTRGQGQRIAVVAPVRHAIAPGHGIPRGLGPLDSPSNAHRPSLPAGRPVENYGAVQQPYDRSRQSSQAGARLKVVRDT